jgi:hypothetical protein
MSAFSALWYLDLRRLRTAIRGIVRSPARLLLWIFIGLYLILQIYTRARLTRHTSIFTFDLADPYASAFAGFMIAGFGATLATATNLGRSVAFAEPVDALFYSRSAMNEHVVILWLQLRQLAIGAPRLLFSALIIVVIFARHGVVGPALGLTGIFLVLTVSALPASMLSRRIPRLKSLGYAVAVFGLLIVAGAVAPLVVSLPSLANAVEALGLGRFLIALWHGNTIALGALYGAVVAALVATALWGRDIYPELYASTRMTEAARAQIRSGNVFAMPASRKPTHSSDTYLRGPWVEIWKQAAFLRRANGGVLIGTGAACAVLLGVVAGLLAHKSADLPFFFMLPFLLVVLVIQTTRSVSLAQDIAKPLWWMGDGSTFGKLAAWTLGSTLPLIAFATVVAIAAFALASPKLIPAAVLLVCSTIAASRAIGVLGYALTPSLLDQRGPGMVIRILMFYGACLPPSVLGVLAAIFLHSAQAALLLTSVAFVAEGAASVALATVRFNRGAVEVALDEAS